MSLVEGVVIYYPYDLINLISAELNNVLFQHIKYHLLNMLKITYDINQQYLKTIDLLFSNLNNFHSLEVVNRVSETQFQVGENSNWIIWRLKG